jgi:tripeptide aminopeptidase
MPESVLDSEEAIGLLMRFLAVEGVTGREDAIGREVSQALLEAGVPKRAISFDKANKKIPLPTQTGNLIVQLPGTVPGRRRMLMTHLDTVPLCAGAKPKRENGRIVPAGATALGADNRTGVACLVNALRVLLRQRLSHPPLTFLFTVREESGLWGARFVDPATLGKPAEAFNFDGRSPAELTIGAVGALRWEVEIFGKAAHAGVYPDRGISATMVAAIALAGVQQEGWFGKVKKGKLEGTSNVGSFGGEDGRSAGQATNVVTDYVHIYGESRSHDTRFAGTITKMYKQAFADAARKIHDHRDKPARVRFQTRRDYYPFKLAAAAPVVAHASEAVERIGLQPELRVTNGGLDANWMVRHGIPTVTFGAGQHNPHTLEEYVDLSEFLDGCRLALALASPSGGV